MSTFTNPAGGLPKANLVVYLKVSATLYSRTFDAEIPFTPSSPVDPVDPVAPRTSPRLITAVVAPSASIVSKVNLPSAVILGLVIPAPVLPVVSLNKQNHQS